MTLSADDQRKSRNTLSSPFNKAAAVRAYGNKIHFTPAASYIAEIHQNSFHRDKRVSSQTPRFLLRISRKAEGGRGDSAFPISMVRLGIFLSFTAQSL